MTIQPLVITDYRARCCGTCKHKDHYGPTDCELGADPLDEFSICATHYEPEGY